MKELEGKSDQTGDAYIEHGNVDVLKREAGIDKESIVKQIIAQYVSL